jgi:heptosyltransferase II
MMAAQRLGLSVAVRMLFGRQRVRGELRRILVLRTGALGDFLFAVPALSVLRRTFPQAEIRLLTAPTTHGPSLAAIDAYSSKSMPWLDLVVPHLVDRVHTFRIGNLRSLRQSPGADIRAFAPDATFLLVTPGERFSSLAKKLAFLRILGASGPVFGWRTRGTYSWLLDVQQHAGRLGHKVQGALRSIAECPLVDVADVWPGRSEVRLSPESRQWAEKQWDIHGLHGHSVVVVAPGSIQLHKQWPIENYVEVARALASDGSSIVVIGTKAEAALGDQIVAAVGPQAINLAGRQIMESAAILERARVLLTNDGGAAHLAAAVGCPTVVIGNGIEPPGAVDPWSDQSTVVRIDVSCAPCYSMMSCPLGTYACVRGVPQDRVLKAARERVLPIVDPLPHLG